MVRRQSEYAAVSLKLFYAPRSSALPARLSLDASGIDYDLVRVDLTSGEQRRPDHLARNAMGRVPVLQDGDFVLTENCAILPYIAKREPGAGLWPEAEQDQARALEWLGFGASNLHPALAHVRRPERYAHGDVARADVVETAHRLLPDLFQIVEARLDGASWAAGPRRSVADFYLLFFWLWGVGPMSEIDRSRTYPYWTDIARRLIADPVVRQVIEEDGLPSRPA